MSGPKKQKYDGVLQALIDAMKAREGDVRLMELHTMLKARIKEGTHREAIVQMIAQDTFLHRVRFLTLYPELIVPYFNRIKRPKS